MPTTIQLERLIACAKELGSGHSLALAAGVRVKLQGGKLVIEENGMPVFHMKVSVQGTHLELDYPRTIDGHQARGWGRLGLLLALRFGMHAGCTTAAAGTQLEPDSYSFWAAAGLQYSVKSNLQHGIVTITRWIHANIPQPGPIGTSVMIIRDRVGGAGGAGSAAAPKRRGSLG